MEQGLEINFAAKHDVAKDISNVLEDHMYEVFTSNTCTFGVTPPVFRWTIV